MNAAMVRWRAAIRDGLPDEWQVPAKSWHARLAGTMEPEMRLLPTLVARGERAIDVGGNYGLYARALDRLGARVAVVEPHPACLRALRAWARSRDRVEVHGFGASDAAGTGALAIPVDADGVEHDAAASLAVSEQGARLEPIELRPLDALGIRDAAFVKVDVEGHEGAVIEGALATITASMPALLIEIEQRHRTAPVEQTVERLAKLGYAGHFLQRGRLVPVSAFSVERHQSEAARGNGSDYVNNFLFLSRERLARGDYAALAARWPLG